MRLLERLDHAGEREVGRDAPLVVVAADAQLLEPCDDLDAERADRGVHAVAAELARRAHRVLLLPDRDGDERVGDAEVRVLPEPDDHEQLVAARVHVEVVAVVEVPVGRGDVVERVRRLVREEVVERAEWHAVVLAERRVALSYALTGI